MSQNRTYVIKQEGHNVLSKRCEGCEKQFQLKDKIYSKKVGTRNNLRHKYYHYNCAIKLNIVIRDNKENES